MARRLYFPASGSMPVTPSSWNFAAQSTNATGFAGTYVRGTTALTTSATMNTGTTNPTHRGAVRYVYGPLKAQTISGTVKGQIRVAESNAGANATLGVAIKIITPAGADRAVLLAYTAADTFTDGSAPEMATTLTNRSLRNASEATSITLTSQSATEGDYLVVELGFRSATGTTRNITYRYGENNSSAMEENETSTNDFHPWIEFSADISFLQTVNVAQSVTVADVATVVRVGAPVVPSVSDSVTVTDAATVALGVNPTLLRSVADDVTVTEATSFHTATALRTTVSDSVTVTEAGAVWWDTDLPIRVTDDATVRLTTLDRIDVAEAVTAADVATVVPHSVTPLTPNVADSVSVADVATLNRLTVALSVSVSEAITTADVATVVRTGTGTLTVSVADAVTVAPYVVLWWEEDRPVRVQDVAVVALATVQHSASAADAISVADVATVSLATVQRTIAAADPVTVADVATLALVTPAYAVSVSDSVTLADVATLATTGAGTRTIDVADAVTVTEAVTLQLSPLPGGPQAGLGMVFPPRTVLYPAYAVGPTVVPRYDVWVADSVTVADSADVTRTSVGSLVVSSAEAVAVSDVATVVLSPLLISGTDSVGVADVATVSLLTVRRTVDVADAVGVADAATVVLTTIRYERAVADSVAVTDVATVVVLTVHRSVSAAEAISVLDVATLQTTGVGALATAASDAVSVSDVATVALTPLWVPVSEALTVADVATVQITTVLRHLAVAEAVSVTDSATVSLLTVRITVSVFDPIPVADVATLVKTSAGALAINREESLTVVDVATVALSPLQVTASEAVGVTDVPTVSLLTIRRTVTVVDGVTVLDVATVQGDLRRLVVDAVSVADVATLQITGVGSRTVSVADTVTVTDAVHVVITPLIVRVGDTVTVTEGTAFESNLFFTDPRWFPKFPDWIPPRVSLPTPSQQALGYWPSPILGGHIRWHPAPSYPAWLPLRRPTGEGGGVGPIAPPDPALVVPLSWTPAVPATIARPLPSPWGWSVLPPAAEDFRWLPGFPDLILRPLRWLPAGAVAPLVPKPQLPELAWLPVAPDQAPGRPRQAFLLPPGADWPRLDVQEARWGAIYPDWLSGPVGLGSWLQQAYRGHPVPIPNAPPPTDFPLVGRYPDQVPAARRLETGAQVVWVGSPITPDPRFAFADWQPVYPEIVRRAADRLAGDHVRPFRDLTPAGDLAWIPVLSPVPVVRRQPALILPVRLEVGELLGIALFSWRPVYPLPLPAVRLVSEGSLVRPWATGPWRCLHIEDVALTQPTFPEALTTPTLAAEVLTYPVGDP